MQEKANTRDRGRSGALGNFKLKCPVLSIILGLCLAGQALSAEDYDFHAPSSDAQFDPEACESHRGVKALVCYFSRFDNTQMTAAEADILTRASIVMDEGQPIGSTAFIAKIIAQDLDAPVFSIKTQTLLPANFNDLMDFNHAQQEQRALPGLQDLPDLAGYDVIFIGYPIWGMRAPRAVSAFVQSLDLRGKQVVFFCGHDGYGAGSSMSALSSLAKGAIIEPKLLALDSSEIPDSTGRILSFVHGLNLTSRQ